MFYENALQFNGKLTELTIIPAASNRTYWNQLPILFKEALIAAGEKRLHYAFPAIPATLYMDFGRTGNRVHFEDIYFEKRYALADLVMAECAEGNGRFVDDIINGVYSLCEESAWQLPPHNSYVRNAPQELLADISEPVLDLFACETGAILAVIYALFEDTFDRIHPFINKNILLILKNRIIKPYLYRHFWWMGHGDEPMCNWTIWCTQNILLTAFLTHHPPALQQRIFEKSCQSIDFFLKDYGTDGCCDEGAQYYRHSALCLFNSLEILMGITGNFFDSLYANEKIQNMAEYILNVHIHDIYSVNYADCSPVAGYAGVREFLFGKRIGNKNMMTFAAKDFQNNPDKLLSKEINLFYHVQNALTYAEISSWNTSCPILYQDIFYESVGVFIARDDSNPDLAQKGLGLYLAVKAGDNNDSHNHNDTGSFTIYKDGKPLFIDIGVETYTKKTFSAKRYELWAMQSQYHNLPTIDGIQQKDGADYYASHVSYSLGDEICSIQMDLSTAYPEETNLQAYIRHAHLKKGKEIRITDSFSFLDSDTKKSHEVVLSLMTYDKPNICTSPYTLTIGNGMIEFSGIQTITVEEIPITDARLQSAWKHEIYRILATAAPDSATVEMVIH